MNEYEQRFINGIPFFISNGDIYNYDTTNKPVHIGKYECTGGADRIGLFPDFKERLSSSITSWRESLLPTERGCSARGKIKIRKSRVSKRNIGTSASTADSSV